MKKLMIICATGMLIAGSALAQPTGEAPSTQAAGTTKLVAERELRNEARAERDVLAQEAMRRAADEMLVLTRAQVYIGALTVIGLLVTIAFTGLAHRQTRTLLSITKQASHDQLRAYIGIKDFTGLGWDEQGREILNFTFHNYGATSARNIRSVYVVWLEPGFPRSAELPSGYDPTIYNTAGDVPPGADWYAFFGFGTPLSAQQKQDIIDRKLSVCFHIRVEWTDFFGSAHAAVWSQIRSGTDLQPHFVNKAYASGEIQDEPRVAS